MTYKIFIILIIKTHLNMSNFPELNCFNKLLLEKMQRMEKKIEKLEKENLYLSNQKKEYKSLRDCDIHDDIDRCWECKLWYDCEDLRGACDGICGCCYFENDYFQCDNCGENYCKKDEMKKIEIQNGSVNCNKCYKGYLLYYIIFKTCVDYDDIDEMVYDKDKVMEELLKKVKTN